MDKHQKFFTYLILGLLSLMMVLQIIFIALVMFCPSFRPENPNATLVFFFLGTSLLVYISRPLLR
jgi:competence protein ComGC